MNLNVLDSKETRALGEANFIFRQFKRCIFLQFKRCISIMEPIPEPHRQVSVPPIWLQAAEEGIRRATLEGPPVLSKGKRKFIQLLCIFTIFGLVLAQGYLLDGYFFTFFPGYIFPYVWMVADFLCGIFFTWALVDSYQFLLKETFGDDRHLIFLRDNPNREPFAVWGNKKCFRTHRVGLLPLCYLSWFAYSTVLLSKITTLIYTGILYSLKREDTTGPQTLMVAIAMAALVFFCLVEGSTWPSRASARFLFVKLVCARASLDIIDTVSVLSLLYTCYFEMDDDKAFTIMETFITLVCCVNFFLPTINLYKLGMTSATAAVFDLPISVANDILHMILLEGPYLVVRILAWEYNEYSQFALMLKNIFGMLVCIRHIIMDTREMIRLWKYARTEVKRERELAEERQNSPQSEQDSSWTSPP